MSGVVAQALYFGKLPSRGDFVRSTQQGALTQMLDQWLSQGLELVSVDPRCIRCQRFALFSFLQDIQDFNNSGIKCRHAVVLFIKVIIIFAGFFIIIRAPLL